ncbi:alpha/beta hydrolase [uncultured Shewanella sp.]|uniref:alpha/beta fold hydrolase n=1 Tax=uncultured Shewanella sp. TaxID=173975 RepID=UPI00261700A4|nr:alpha/beta hydrolase [uncultured Shewanella sp.]
MSKGIQVSGSGPVVILLHSSLSSKEQWKSLIKQLAPRFTCVNVDLQGYGSLINEKISVPYSLKCEVERIQAFLQQEAISDPYYLVGHSFGGAVALRLADAFKQQVKALCIFEPVAFHLLNEANPQRQQVSELAVRMDKVTAVEAAALFTDYWNGEGYFSALPKPIQQGLAELMPKVSLDFGAIISEPKTARDYAESISANILLMTGDKSRSSAKAVVKVIGEHLNHVTKIEINGGHMAPLLQSSLVNPLIMDYLFSHI